MTDTMTVSLCESCIWFDAYGEILPETDSTPLSRLDGYELSTLPCADDSCDCYSCDSPSTKSHFGRLCDGCDTRYAGNRYDYVAVRVVTE